MLRGVTIKTLIKYHVASRVGSPKARFKTAVTLGFFIATLGFMAAGPDQRTSSAQEDLLDSLAAMFGQHSGNAGARYSGEPGYGGSSRPALQRRVARRHFVRSVHNAVARAARAQPNVFARARRAQLVEMTGRSMCVRLCDGYVFPVGDYHGGGDNPAHEAACKATCPGAETSLYVLPSGADKIEQAVAIGSGRSYSELPDAYHYTTVLDDACTCQKPGTDGMLVSLLRDFTLRRGDAVMTMGGFRVFHGKGRYPYSRADFMALAQSRDVPQRDRATFGAIERASLISRDDSLKAQASVQPQVSPAAPPKSPRREQEASR